VATAIVAAGLGARAPATTVVAKDFAALCDEADMIFVGTVTGVESRWADPDRQAIETLVTFGDLSWERGTPRGSVTLRFAGGEVDGLHEAIAGIPHFAVGERRVIFARDGTYVSPIVGFDQGALRVVDAPDGPRVVDVQSEAGGAAFRLGAPAASTPAAPVPLDQFLERIRRHLDQRTPGAP
jgi:hypothetical protein